MATNTTHKTASLSLTDPLAKSFILVAGSQHHKIMTAMTPSQLEENVTREMEDPDHIEVVTEVAKASNATNEEVATDMVRVQNERASTDSLPEAT